MSSSSSSEPQVPSPMYAALSQLYANIQRDESSMAQALQDACQRMASRQVWIGPVADSWDAELTSRSADLAKNVRATVEAVHSALAGTPPKCTPGEAQLYGRMLGGWLQ